MSDVLSTFTLGDHKAERIADYNGFTDSPREYDGNVGTLVMPHDRYRLGDHPDRVDGVAEVMAAMKRVRRYRLATKIMDRWIRLRFGARHVFPVGLGDHSGLWTYLGGGHHWTDPGGWDSGTIGFFFDTDDGRAEHFGDQARTDADVEAALHAEFNLYKQFVANETYGIRVYREVSCNLGGTHAIDDETTWGFIGTEATDEEAKMRLLEAVSTDGTLPHMVTDAEGKQMPYRLSWNDAAAKRATGLTVDLDYSSITTS